MSGRNLDAGGHIRREGSPGLAGPAFGAVVADLRGCIAARFVRTGFTLVMPGGAAGPAAWTGSPVSTDGSSV